MLTNREVQEFIDNMAAYIGELTLITLNSMDQDEIRKKLEGVHELTLAALQQWIEREQ